MKEQLISFETAKLAKEKGFDLEADWFYNSIGEEHLYNHYDYSGLPKKHIFWKNTQSLLQKWLREEKELHVTIYQANQPEKGSAWEWGYNIETIDAPNDLKKHDWYFKTYEEALEEGLKEALKLL